MFTHCSSTEPKTEPSIYLVLYSKSTNSTLLVDRTNVSDFVPKPHSPLVEQYSRIPGNTISSLLCATFSNYCANLRKNNFWGETSAFYVDSQSPASRTSYYTHIITLDLFSILFRKLNRRKTIVQSVPAGRVASLCTAAASKCMGKHHGLAQIS